MLIKSKVIFRFQITVDSPSMKSETMGKELKSLNIKKKILKNDTIILNMNDRKMSIIHNEKLLFNFWINFKKKMFWQIFL